MDLTKISKAAIANALKGQSKLNEDVLMVAGMSSINGRHLLNNLCSFPEAVYFEIGTWKGSTVIAAAFGNDGKFYALDSFRKRFKQPDCPSVDFYANKEKFEVNANFTFFESDSWEFDPSQIEDKVNVYFYDGDHSLEGTQLAFSHYDSIFADQFIMVMDDWNRGHIRRATQAALKNYTILWEKELYTPGKKNDSHGNGFGSMEARPAGTWWNGLYVAVLQKK